jgi:hypothetical protein
MANHSRSDLFAAPAQGDLFGDVVPEPKWRPNPDKVRRRLERILAEARAAQKMPWDYSQQSLYRGIFPDMTRYLPDEEGEQYRVAFEKEWERLKAT